MFCLVWLLAFLTLQLKYGYISLFLYIYFHNGKQIVEVYLAVLR